MKVAVVGCTHGELNQIYETIRCIEERDEIKVDFLICCGDFESIRDKNDLENVLGPKKYRQMKDFYQYYTGEKIAPVLTLFIGGNHEASNYLWELPCGGWVAKNIYYLGFASVVNISGLRICGISGIFDERHYLKEHFERPPLSKSAKKTFYITRKIDVEKLKLLKNDPPDILLSRDWPTNIYKYGDKEELIKRNPPFKAELESNTLTGNDGAEELLHCLQPTYWFSGHMHVKFTAVVEHLNGKTTEFLALDKCSAEREFLQIMDIDGEKEELVLRYDPSWLRILELTNQINQPQEIHQFHPPSNPRTLDNLEENFTDLEVIPFCMSADGKNMQTSYFCERFGLDNPTK